MDPKEVQQLLDEQRQQILAEVDSKIAAAIQAERDRLHLRVLVNTKGLNTRREDYSNLTPEAKSVANASREEERAKEAVEDEAEIERLKGIVPEKDWPKQAGPALLPEGQRLFAE